MTFRFSTAATDDLDHIWVYTAEKLGIAAADRLIDRVFDSTSSTLVVFPEAGRLRPEFGSDIRSFAVASFVVFYTAIGRRGVTVVRVLHASRDLTKPLMSLLAAA